ncbi:MAG TPA: sigma-70 family RNA polymerase sigma factor [Pirellulaceae bacterium]|nr:sigma-70 family RNA polymerase sigma factor [Pirellulaceae bacterium]
MDEIDLSVDESHAALKALLEGDQSALGRLTQSLRSFLKHIVRQEMSAGLRSNFEDDSDIVQQALAEAIAKVKEFRGQSTGEWRAWLAAIARNQARMNRRYWQADRRAVRRQIDAGSCSLDSQPGEQSSPSTAVVRQEDAERLRLATSKLSEQHQQIISWRLYEGLAHADIADRLGISVEASRQRCKAAMDALRRAWSQLSP